MVNSYIQGGRWGGEVEAAATLCCSEATFQDDVVAIAAFCCKRETLGIFQEERHGAVAWGNHGRHGIGRHSSPITNVGETTKSGCTDRSRYLHTCLPV